MQKQTIDGHEVEFELADENFPKDRVMPFYVKTLDGTEYDKYHVVIGKTDKDIPKHPIDGHICAICLIKQDAMMVAASILVAKQIVDEKDVADGALKKLGEKAREMAERSGWDIKKAVAKMDELMAQGKSKDEVLAYMKEHMDDFKKPDAPTTDKPKTAEEW